LNTGDSPQLRVRELLDAPDRVILGHPLIRRRQRQHRHLLLHITPHRLALPPILIDPRRTEVESIARFSAAC